jgi:hypothetical protein
VEGSRYLAFARNVEGSVISISEIKDKDETSKIFPHSVGSCGFSNATINLFST